MPSVLSGIGGLGDAVSSVFGGIGDLAEAKAYKKAQQYAEQNAVISREAGDIKLEQTQRQIFKTLGAQQAGYAGAGLASSGSAQYILRDSISQGALEKAIVNEQAQINVTGYLAQAAQFAGMASAAKAAGAGGILGGIIKGVATIASLSDRRLKTDIERIGMHGMLGLYRFRFIGDDQVRAGVMADEVAVHVPEALGPLVDGYMTVNYDRLGLGHLVQEG